MNHNPRGRPRTAIGLCDTPGCGRPVKCRGLCSTCYHRQRKSALGLDSLMRREVHAELHNLRHGQGQSVSYELLRLRDAYSKCAMTLSARVRIRNEIARLEGVSA